MAFPPAAVGCSISASAVGGESPVVRDVVRVADPCEVAWGMFAASPLPLPAPLLALGEQPAGGAGTL